MQRCFQRRALGTDCLIVSYGGFPSRKAIDVFNSLIDEMDQAASRFRSDSEINSLLSGSAPKSVVVSPLLFDALEAAMKAAAITGGYVDPTVGDSLVALGYESDFALFATRPQTLGEVKVRIPIGHNRVRLNREERSVTVPRGVIFDLGATGKAFLADRIRSQVESDTGEKILINLGGDISASYLPEGDYWQINITDDHSLNPDSPGTEIGILGGGVATSSTNYRRWYADSILVHHIVDPFTGTSAVSPFDAVTVLAGTALDANIASTGCIAMGEKGPRWLGETGLPAYCRSGVKARYFGGWKPSDGIRRCG